MLLFVWFFGRLKHGQAILMLKNNLCAGEKAKAVVSNSYDVGVANTEVENFCLVLLHLKHLLIKIF